MPVEKRCRSGSRKSCWHESHFTLSTIRRERFVRGDILRRQKWQRSDLLSSAIVKNTRDRDKKKKFPRRPLHTRKINQRVNLNITNWTYESENPCFLSEPVYTGMNWWEFELSGVARWMHYEKKFARLNGTISGVQKAHYVGPSCLQWP